MTLVVAAPKEESKMYENPIKTRIRQTVRFVQQHPTLCACAATMVITAKLTRDDDVAAMKNIAAQLLQNEGEKHALLLDLTSFIDARGLRDEFMAWVPRLHQEGEYFIRPGVVMQ